MDEYCQPIAGSRRNLEEDLTFIFPEAVWEVIALTHKYAVQDHELGFYVYDRANLPPTLDDEKVMAPALHQTLNQRRHQF